jgi:cysteine desulfurase / selenocysteine lyase
MEIPGVAVRAGTHCVPLLARYGVTATWSFALYNTKDEVDTLAESMVKAREFFA